MARRDRQFKEKEVLLVIVRQGGTIPCGCCGEPITEADILTGNVEKEHIHERGLGGPDEPHNCRYSHAARPCHATVTHGSPATWAGSSRHKIKKATDPERIEKFVVEKPDLDVGTAFCTGCQTPFDPRKPHRCAARAVDRLIEPPRRCRGCGEYPETCTCAPRAKRSAFGGRR